MVIVSVKRHVLYTVLMLKNNKIISLIHDQFNRINEGGPLLLARNLFLFLLTPFLLLTVLGVRFLRPLVLIRFGELISSRIGHFAANTEIYLCERDLGMHGKRGLDIFYINSSVSNRQLMKMWGRILPISPFAAGLDMLNRALPGGREHRIPYRNDQDKDMYGVLESTEAHINFTDYEERSGRESLKKFGISGGSPFVCFLSRSPDYLDTVFPKGSWHYHGYRDSDISNFVPAAVELTRRGYFAIRMGAAVNEKLKADNPMVIDYAAKYRTDFLDIYLSARCRFHLGDNGGFNCVPMIFRRPLAIVNMIPLEYAPTWGSNYLFIPKKLWLREEGRFLSFREILSSEIGKFHYSRQYEESGIKVIENTPEEITALAVEMDLRLRDKWEMSKSDEELQQRFWGLFKASGINRIFRSRIGAEFLRQNRELLG